MLFFSFLSIPSFVSYFLGRASCMSRPRVLTYFVYSTTALKNLKSLAIAPSVSAPVPAAEGGAAGTAAAAGGKRRKAGMGIPDCCICLFPVSIRQALFIAPCSHAFHYKCLRPLLEQHHPAFSCPLCRTFADLEEDVEVEAEELTLI
ncbi:hypothetical protein DFH08DRAFT_215722 [Mycena albidolilacea]|uniref:RING-type domain-containing protein n=1 Tax=Mycena albidolilacea TaxID=1033008 RepID=A0AAD7EP62_9AGAR|nr:hypothetical protein DFH08DRAFT_215722 [Mycena albidolilacea]